MTAVDEDIRDLAELIALVAQGVWEHIGTDEATRIAGKALGIKATAATRLEAKPSAEVSTVSQETFDKRTKVALDELGPLIAQSIRITKEGKEHRLTHEFGAVADCRLCQDERARE